MLVANYTGIVTVLVGLLELIVLAFALIDAALRPASAYLAADKQKKPFWLIILGLGLLVVLYFPPLGFLSIIALVAGFVYIVDARPALRTVGRPGKGSSSDGPYGPW